jgi:hypothetical protein
MLFFKQLFCKHRYKFVRLEKPFYGFPIYDDNGFWVKDEFLHICTKCKKNTMLDDILEKVD